MRGERSRFNEMEEKSANEEYMYNLLECFYVCVYIYISIFISVLKVTLIAEA